MLSPVECKNLELGKRLSAFLEEIVQIEIAYHEAGPQRSAEIARSFILKSLKAVTRLVRAGLRIEDSYRRQISGNGSLRDFLAFAPIPSPLTLAWFELNEVQSGRIAPLLRHDAKDKELGDGPFYFLRRYIRAGAAAAVQVLIETKLGEKAAADMVADALNKSGFVNPRGDSYAGGACMDWRKRRFSSKANFNDHYQEWLLVLRETASRVEHGGLSWTVEERRAAILFRLWNLSEVFAYRSNPHL